MDFVYDARERRRERADKKPDAKPAPADYTLVPKGMMLVPIDYAASCETAATINPAPQNATQPTRDERTVSSDAVVIEKSKTKTIDELYKELTKEQKRFFDGLLSYAKAKPNAIEYRNKTEVQIKADRKNIVRLNIKKGMTVAKFRLENELMKQFRKNNAETRIFVKDTAVFINDAAAFETAKGLIDVAEENKNREIEAAKERRKQKLKEKRLTEKKD
jgi:hypothetical protein